MPENQLSLDRDVMRRGSVSFYLAACILPPRARAAVMSLYAWCRHCDDVIDGQVLGHGPMTTGDQMAAKMPLVESLLASTTAAMHDPSSSVPPFAAMGAICCQNAIPQDLPQDLIAGMRMDVERTPIVDLNDLELYCYRVAGTVGVMFSHIVGVSDAKALRHAAALGTAMQMTNIARDVTTDFEAGRVYLPKAWLNSARVAPETLALPENRGKLRKLVFRLLDLADRHYDDGDRGLVYLPLRVAASVAAARQIYAAIGTEIRRRGDRAWDTRVVLPLHRKVALAALGLWQALGTIPDRIRSFDQRKESYP